MQHALALVRQQRVAQQVEARLAGLDLGQEGRARVDARALAAQPLEPRREMPRDTDAAADRGGRDMPSRRKRLHLAAIARERTVDFEEMREPSARPGISAHARGRIKAGAPSRRSKKISMRAGPCAMASRKFFAWRWRRAASTPSICLHVPRPLTR